jgi:hypothetical protein
MPSLPFQGAGRPLSIAGLAGIGHKLGVHAVEIWTVLAVETSGCGYMPDRRPEILYERHVFHRLTKGKYDDGDISAPTAGGYGDSGAHQYDRLALAIAKNRAAALQSCSWGIGQIMGENYALAGFSDVELMVAAMSESRHSLTSARLGVVRSRLQWPELRHSPL